MSQNSNRQYQDHLLPFVSKLVDLGTALLRWRKIWSDDLDIRTGTVTEAPVEGTDIVNKDYVDGAVTGSLTTVEAADGTPSYSPVTTLQFDEADGFVITNPSPGVVRIDITVASASGWTDDGTVVRLTTATDQVAIGTATPFTGGYGLTVLDDQMLALSAVTGGATWKFQRETVVGMGSDEMLSISPNTNDDLKLYLSSVTGGQRVYIWDDAVALPNIPHTGVLPTFAVHGDLLLGDLCTFSPSGNAYIVGCRTATNLVPATDITHYMCAQDTAGVEPDGGATIDLYPTDNNAGATHDGIVELLAYGRGSGSLANSILFANRSGVSTVTRRWQMTSAGMFVPFADNSYDIGTTANRVRRVNVNEGIVFPATQVPSADANTLDDYEEGTWTPVLTFATPGDLSVTYTAQAGLYTKIGRVVYVTCNLITATFTHTTASGALRITGLPFTVAGGFNFPTTASWQGITKASYTFVSADAVSAQTYMEFNASGSGQALSLVVAADCPTGGTVRMSFSGFYSV